MCLFLEFNNYTLMYSQFLLYLFNVQKPDFKFKIHRNDTLYKTAMICQVQN